MKYAVLILALAWLTGCQIIPANATPPHRDIVGEIDWSKLDVETALEAQMRLDDARQVIAQRNAEAEQRIRTERNITYGLAALGALGVLGGAAACLLVGRRIGAIAAVVGVALVLASTAIGPLNTAMAWAIPAALALLLIGLAFAGAMKLWVLWQTNRQAARQEAEARHMLANGGNRIEAAVLLASAKQLKRVGRRDYSAKMIEPSAEAVNVLKGATA